MNRKSAYEEALSRKLDQAQLPDEEVSWQKMKRLLDDKDDRTSPFLFLRDYRLLGLIAVLLIALAIWLINSQLNEKKSHNRLVEKSELLQPGQSSTNRIVLPALPSETIKNPGDKQPEDSKKIVADEKYDQPGIATDEQFRGKLGTSENERNVYTIKDEHLATHKGKESAAGFLDPQKNNSNLQLSDAKLKVNYSKSKRTENTNTEKRADLITETRGVKPTGEVILDNTDSAGTRTIRQDKDINLQDSAVGEVKNIVAKDTQSEHLPVVKPGQPSSRKYIVSAGPGIQQQIQVGGQQPVKYGYNASSLVSDYIPSVWINFERKDIWYLQTGFVYSSPQLVKEFAFNQRTKMDTLGSVTNTLKLKKTFYSQLPLSFNYYVKSYWSAGAGITFTWLRGAIAEKETSTRNTSWQTPVVVRQIVPINSFNDSFLYRSHSFFTVQTDYQWKRVSVGLRYSRDLQSYIKYVMPDGTVADDRNWGLQAILRVKLWQKEVK